MWGCNGVGVWRCGGVRVYGCTCEGVEVWDEG